MRQAAPPRSAKSQALERLQTHAPDGPPFLGILLDVPTMRCLAHGVCNSRAEVAAQKAVADFDAHTLVIETPKKRKRA